MTFDETSRPYEDEDDTGALDEGSETADKLPGAPSADEDDSAAGDTDQHSSSDS